MRSINLSTFSHPSRSVYDPKGIYYIVLLGNRTVHKFPNKRACQVFLTETSLMLSRKMHEVNMYQGQLYAEYRRIWPYLFDKKADNVKLAEIDKTLHLNLKDVPEFLIKMVDMDYSPNYNTLVFHYLDFCYKWLLGATQSLIDFYRHRSQGAEAHQYHVIYDTLNKSHIELKRYGRDRENVIYNGD